LESSPAARRDGLHRAFVLNAFRHHWNLHGKTPAGSPNEYQCSTPFGIIGIFTMRPEVYEVDRIGAQRLSASLESSRYLLDSHSLQILVLNAFRHHWNLHIHVIQDKLLMRPAYRSAQRLSASLESSPLAGVPNIAALGCSTPFGIIGIFTA